MQYSAHYLGIGILMSLTLGTGLLGCKDTQFASGGRTGAGNTGAPLNGDQNPWNQNNMGNNPNMGNNGPGMGGEGPLLGNLTPQEQCIRTKAAGYNFALIFDKSGSQANTDPTKVRRDGALAFVDQFAAFQAKSPNTDIFFNSSAFDSRILAGQMGWVRVDPQGINSIKNDINFVTADVGSGTRYVVALQEAMRMFSNKVSPNSQKKELNYVVFLSDGKPNDGRPGILTAVNQLVSQYNVSMIAIASGTNLDSDDEAFVQSMAMPIGGPNPGIYKRARSAQDLYGVWQQIYNEIGTCN